MFGISGLPIGEGRQKFNHASAIPYVKAFGLDAMELLFVHSVNVTDRNKDVILAAKRKNDLYLSAHGSYYVNLNAAEPRKREESVQRILAAAEALAKVGGRSLIFHPGFYLRDSAEAAYAAIREQLAGLPCRGIDYRLETTGKPTQFGHIEELVALCKELPACKLCVDFAHIHARGSGALRSYDDFAAVLQLILRELGRPALDDLHIHIGGVAYSHKGEKHHLPVRESDFNYMACLEALKDYDVKGCVICEGPLVEWDALFLKRTFMAL